VFLCTAILDSIFSQKNFIKYKKAQDWERAADKGCGEGRGIGNLNFKI